MDRHRPDRRQLKQDEIRLLSHPVRLGILGLFTKDSGRSLLAADLLADLAAEDPHQFKEFGLSQIAYHRARLQDAGLLPS